MAVVLMALLSFLLLLVAVTSNGSLGRPNCPGPDCKPLWMLFVRHPGKTFKGPWKGGKDAPLSGQKFAELKDDGSVKKVTSANKKKEGWDLKKSGVRQMWQVYKNAGKALIGITTSTVRHGKGDAAKLERAMLFQNLKSLFTSARTKFRFETSDLRRSQLEAIALRKSLEDAVQSPAFANLSKGKNTVGTQRQKAILKNLQNSEFYILRSLAETTASARSMPKLKDFGVFYTGNAHGEAGHVRRQIPSSRSHPNLRGKYNELQATWGGRMYWEYAFVKGMPKGLFYDDSKPQGKRWSTEAHPFTKKVHGAFKKYVLGTKSQTGEAQDGLIDKIVFKDSWFLPGGTNFVHHQLKQDWKDEIDLVVAVGHGGWYKQLVEKYARDDIIKDKLDRQLHYTEFVLMRWGEKDGHLKIHDAYSPNSVLYQLPAVGRASKLLENEAREGDFGDDYDELEDDGIDDDERDDFHSYAAFEQYGDFDEYYGYNEFGDYDEFDDYNDHDQYDQYDQYNEEALEYYYGDDSAEYDDGDYEESLYETALVNLMKAKQQFNVPSRLLARERRMKAPSHGYQ